MFFAVGKTLEGSKEKAVPYVTSCNIFVKGHLDIDKMKGQDTGNSLILAFSPFHGTFK